MRRSARRGAGGLLERQRRQLLHSQAIGGFGSWEWDIVADTVEWSDELCRIYGVEPGRRRSREEFLALVHFDDRARVESVVRSAYETREPFVVEHRIVRAGEIRVIHGRGEIVTDRDGRALRMLGTGQDVTDQRTAEQSRRHLAALVDCSEDAIIAKSLDGVIERWNRGAQELFGYTAAEVVGRPISILVPPSRRDELALILGQIKRGESVEPLETVRIAKNGHEIDVSLRISLIYDADDRLVGASSIARSITRQKQLELQLRRSSRYFDLARDLTVTAGFDGRFKSANPALERVLGWTEHELLARQFVDLVHPDDREATLRELRKLADGEVTLSFVNRYAAKDGSYRWLDWHAIVPPDEPLMYASARDVTERITMEAQLQHLADHDALTGLFNRRRFTEELERALARSRRRDDTGAVLFLDLDGFKFVNDTLGHAAGDALIARVGGLLRRTVRQTDTLARMGGDEFAVLLEDCDRAAAVNVAEKLLETLRRDALAGTERRGRLSSSIGIALFGGDEQVSADELVVEADIAMYEAKDEGKDRHAVYDLMRRRHNRPGLRESWSARLERAIESDGFVLHAQPIAAICGSGTPAFELLLRLPDELGDLILPGTFLHNAERLGLVEQIDRWVIERAVRHLHESHACGSDLTLSVNVSGRTMGDPALGSYVAALLEAYPIPPGRLIVEITETAAITSIELAGGLAHELHALGCLLALDDFGAGFASFYYLKHLHFDYLKIDGEFIRNLCVTPTDQLVVKAIVTIAQGLGTRTVAEFVGDDDTVGLLREFGIDYGQGYHLGRPSPLDETLPYLLAAPVAR